MRGSWGLALLIKEDLSPTLITLDVLRAFVVLGIKVGAQSLIVVAIYAPNTSTTRTDCWTRLNQVIEGVDVLLMGGWNILEWEANCSHLLQDRTSEEKMAWEKFSIRDLLKEWAPFDYPGDATQTLVA